MAVVRGSSNACTQAGLPYTTVYADSIGTTVQNVRILYSGFTEFRG